jgi:malonyl-CoA O-methyltransferase
MSSANHQPPTLDGRAAGRWQRIAPAQAPWLHEEVGRRMLDRLQWVKLQPAAWCDWGPVRGSLEAHRQLAEKYPQSLCYVAEAQENRALAAIKTIATAWWNPAGWRRGPVRFEMPPDAGIDMLWANMALHETDDPQALMARWYRALRTDGFLMFSCLGPDTAMELRSVYQAMGWPPAGHELTDMHDWGDMLVHTGFAEPVMDMERIRLTFDTPARLLAELAGLGRNFHPARFAALRGRGFRGRLEAAIDRHMARGPDGRLALTMEVVYGHAIKPQPRVKVSAMSSVSVSDMREMLHRQSADDSSSRQPGP